MSVTSQAQMLTHNIFTINLKSITRSTAVCENYALYFEIMFVFNLKDKSPAAVSLSVSDDRWMMWCLRSVFHRVEFCQLGGVGVRFDTSSAVGYGPAAGYTLGHTYVFSASNIVLLPCCLCSLVKTP